MITSEAFLIGSCAKPVSCKAYSILTSRKIGKWGPDELIPNSENNNMTFIPRTSEGATAGLPVAMRQLARSLPAGSRRKAIPQCRSGFQLQNIPHFNSQENRLTGTTQTTNTLLFQHTIFMKNKKDCPEPWSQDSLLFRCLESTYPFTTSFPL